MVSGIKTKKGRDNSLRWRFALLKLSFFVLGAAIIGRLFSLQIINHQEYTTLAERQQGTTLTTSSKRGTIYFQDKDKKYIAAAINKEWPAVAIMPNAITDPAAVSDLLSSILHTGTSSIQALLEKKNDPFELIARKIPDDTANALREAIQTTNTAGISVFSEFRRFYPVDTLAAGVIGFVNFENDVENGQYGIERWYNDELSGKKSVTPSSDETAKDVVLFFGRKIIKPKETGNSVILTIDPNIERVAEDELAKVVQKWNAASGAVLIMDPTGGRILAMSGYPTFNPNEYSKTTDLSVFKNPLVDSQYELGSIVKPITMAVGINEKKITPETTYTDTGEVVFGKFHIKNFDLQAHGMQTMTQVLEKSLNTGAIYVEKLLGKEIFFSYLQKFGFGQKTGIAFPNEAKGDISNLSHMRDADYATASFGQGISMTPLQIAVAVSAIANGGYLVTPYVADAIQDDSGNTVRLEHPIRGQIISKETSESLTNMLVSAVKNGFENHAAVNGYFVAGKTGTAQVPSKNRAGYDPNLVIHSFVGYAPAFKPKFLIFLQLNEPKGIKYASSSLTPTFHEIAKYMLNYYEVPLDIPLNTEEQPPR